MPDSKRLPFAISQYRVKINIGTFTDTRYWTNLSGVRITWNNREYSDGLSNNKFKLPTSRQYDDVTLSKPFQEGDQDVYNRLLAANGQGEYVDVFVQPVKGDGYQTQNVGGNIRIQYCTVNNATILKEINTIGDDIQTMEISLSPGSINSQGSIIWWNDSSVQGVAR